MTVGCSRALARAFFSERFSFRLLLDFLLLDWRGDLSATAGSSDLRDDAHARSRTMPVRTRADPDGAWRRLSSGGRRLATRSARRQPGDHPRTSDVRFNRRAGTHERARSAADL